MVFVKESRFCGYLYKLVAILISVLIFIVVPAALALSLPIHIYRIFISKFAKCFRPDLGKILSFGNHMLASTDTFLGNTQNTTVIAFKVKGKPDLEESRKRVIDRIINIKTEGSLLKYPELKQYPEKWMGYYFWKNDEIFDVKNHVYFYEKKKCENETALDDPMKYYTEEDAADVEAELITKPHTRGRSPWEIVILNPVEGDGDDGEEHSYIFYRNNHLLTDGYGIMKLFSTLCDEKPNVAKPDYYPAQTFWRKFIYFTIVFFRTPYDLMIIPLKTIHNIENEFRIDNKLLNTKHIGSRPLVLPLEHLKEIRRANNCSLTAVQYAAWSGALRRLMINKNMSVPNYIQCTSPQPLPLEHPTKLRIQAGVWMMLLPIGIEDPVERLKAIEFHVREMKGSATAVGMYYFTRLTTGVLPISIQNHIYPMVTGTACLNCFPGPSDSHKVFSRDITHLHFSYGQTKALFSALFSSVSYCGKIYMKTTINTKIFTNKSDINLFNTFIKDELDALNKQSV